MKKYLNKINFKYSIALIAVLVFAIGCEESNLRDGIRQVTFKPTADATLITVGETIKYTDSSVNVTSRIWSFESGSITSSDQQVVDVTYDTDGEFGTTLEVTSNDGTVTENTFNVEVFPQVTAGFNASSNAARIGSDITFTNTSQNTESAFEDLDAEVDDFFLWEFEGGIPATSSAKDPVVKYPNVGLYSVKLTVFRRAPKNGAITIKNDFINIVDVPVIAPATTTLVDLGSKILITYDTALNNIDASKFNLKVDDADAGFTIAIDGSDPNSYAITLDAPITEGQTIVLNYTGGGDFAATGELLAPIVDLSVTNSVVNLFAKGDFEVDASTYDFANGFLGSNAAAISADLVDGEGAGGSKAMVFTVTDNSAAGAFRTVFGDKEKANGKERVNLITPVSSGKTYVVRAKVKYTGAKPQELGIKFITFPWNGQHQDSFLTLQDTNDWQDVEGEITVTANITPEAYASPRIKVDGACVVILDNVKIYEK